MKKNAIKAFTLVEMLIVIVIIGILIASLMPRMSAAQGRARDVARKNDLNQISTAIQAYNGDHNKMPATAGTWTAIDEDTLSKLQTAGLGGDVVDPQSNAATVLHTTDAMKGKYLLDVMTRNSVSEAGYVLVAYVETPGSANYVLASTSKIVTATATTDTKDIVLCKDIEKSDNPVASDGTGDPDPDNCRYSDTNQLAYVIVY